MCDNTEVIRRSFVRSTVSVFVSRARIFIAGCDVTHFATQIMSSDVKMLELLMRLQLCFVLIVTVQTAGLAQAAVTKFAEALIFLCFSLTSLLLS